ncbi:methyltransferase [Candidatus Heimdallarchaeota archaeon B3_Heim]|nr:MAG: methyltransferase [Candidatus Heimdallarchaeota archaeon B3_Heim]
MDLKDIIIASDESHHLYKRKPMYSQRFRKVLKFHPPGFAPVYDDTGTYHIRMDGTPAYRKRFIATFGFYYSLAAVITQNGWTHINPSGEYVYNERHSWVGNYQYGYCAIRDKKGYYFHIDMQGSPLYSEKHLYAGDFRDGIAVVRLKNGLCTHIDPQGKIIHNKMFEDLDVYHKGFARAHERNGWFHIDVNGNPVYTEKYLMVEPFYNGQSLVHRYNGEVGVINEQGKWIHTVWIKEK